MKKIIFLLFALPLLGIVSSCNDESNLPDVDININFDNGIISESQVYVVKPDTLFITGITVEAVNPNHDAMVAGLVKYHLDGFYPGFVAYPNEKVAIPTKDLREGPHVLTAEMNIAEEGCELARAFVSVKFNVVNAEADIPGSQSDWHSTLPVEVTMK